MKKLILIFAVMLMSMIAAAQTDCYILGGGHFKPDTAVWSFNSSTPSLLRAAGYFNNQSDTIKHKKEKMWIAFEPVFFPADSGKVMLEQLTAYPLVYSKIYKIGYTGAYYAYIFPTSSTSLLRLNFFIGTQGLDHPDLVALFETLTPMSSAAMDHLAGYPLAEKVNSDSLFQMRKKEFEQYYRGDLNTVYAEHLYLLDQYIDFSFSKWEAAMAKDAVKDYSDCEMALSRRIATPANIAWLSMFSPKSVNFNDGLKDLRKKFHRLPQGRHEIFGATEGDGERGEVFISYPQVGEEIKFHSFQIVDNGCVESSFTLKPGVHYTDELFLANPFFEEEGRLNTEICEVNEWVENTEFLFELKRDTLIEQAASFTFSDYYLLSADHYSEKPISFKSPVMKGVTLFMEAVLDESYSRTYRSAVREYLSGEVNIIDIPVEFRVKAYHTDYRENVPVAQRMYRSPILITDLNKNGMLEYLDVFIQSGGIVQTTIYEKDSLRIRPIVMTGDMMKELYQIPLLQGLMILSTQPDAYEEGVVSGTYIQKLSRHSNSDYYESDLVNAVEMAPAAYYEDEGIGMNYGYGYPQRTSNAYKAGEVTVEARYRPGEAELKKFIEKNLIYPEGEKKKQHVTVLVTVLINEKGQLSVGSSQSSTGKQDGFTTEAHRLCQLTNKSGWYPAEINGKPVAMTRIITVEF